MKELRLRYRPPAATEGKGPGFGTRAGAPPTAAGGKVFVCHASEDKDSAREVHDALQAAGLDPWLDREALRGGDRWDAQIESTIKEVDYFVILNSRALAAKSRETSYVNKEGTSQRREPRETKLAAAVRPSQRRPGRTAKQASEEREAASNPEAAEPSEPADGTVSATDS